MRFYGTSENSRIWDIGILKIFEILERQKRLPDRLNVKISFTVQYKHNCLELDTIILHFKRIMNFL